MVKGIEAQWLFKDEINPSRLDAVFYRTASTANERAIRDATCGVDTLANLTTRLFKGAFYVLQDEYRPTGVPFLRTLEIKSGYVATSDCVYLDSETHERESRTAVNSGDVILAKTGGSIGYSAVVPSWLPNANICQDLVGLNVKVDVDPYFLHAFVQTTYGQIQAIRWGQGNAHPHLGLDGIREWLIPTPPAEIQRAIGNMVRKSECLRIQGGKLRGEVDDLFRSRGFFQDRIPDPAHFISVGDLDSRLDTLHYRSDLVANLHTLISFDCGTLGDKSAFTGLQDGDHGNPVYGEGPYYYRASELNDYRYVPERFPKLEGAYASSVSNACIARSGDVIFSIVGTLGLAAVVPEKNEGVMSRGIAKVRPVELPAHYVKAFMRTPAFDQELMRQSVGTVQRGVSLEALRNVPIPILEEDEILQIAQKESEADALADESDLLFEEALVCTESLITNSLDETRLESDSKEIDEWLATVAAQPENERK